MTSPQNVLNIPKVLTENIRQVRDELGSDWVHFQCSLAPLLARLTYVADNDVPERIVNEVWQVCCRYPFVKGLILGYDLGFSAKRSPHRWRKLEAADYGDETFVREIINRFQALSDSLKEVERSEGSPELTKQERRPIRYRGC